LGLVRVIPNLCAFDLFVAYAHACYVLVKLEQSFASRDFDEIDLAFG
jgi:hypothetical protein